MVLCTVDLNKILELDAQNPTNYRQSGVITQTINQDAAKVGLFTKCVKDVARYNLRDLFIGSEGTLGIVTEVLLKLLPRPETRRTILAGFGILEAAAETDSEIIANCIVPCSIDHPHIPRKNQGLEVRRGPNRMRRC